MRNRIINSLPEGDRLAPAALGLTPYICALRVAIAALAAPALPVAASELSYTFLEFGTIVTETELEAEQLIDTQTVRLDPGEGDGLAISGSLAIGRRFYLAGSYRSAVISTDAFVTSPEATTVLSGSFNWTTSHAGFGAIVPIGDRVDFVAEVAGHSVQYDFGSFAGENFDTDASGGGMSVGFRFNPHPSFELAIAGVASEIGEVDLATGQFDSGSRLAAALRWYIFEDIGLGLDYAGGDVPYLGASIRFGFGELRAGN